jgi:DNA-binding NarL/FixJ family response regulator
MRRRAGRAARRVAVEARDPKLRQLLEARIRAGGGVLVESPAGRPEAVVRALDDGPPLTARETDVISLLADGLANKQIAAALGISPHTVKFHVESIMRRLSAANRAEAVCEGIRRGLIVL